MIARSARQPLLQSIANKKIDWSRLFGGIMLCSVAAFVGIETPWFLWGRAAAPSWAGTSSGLLVLFTLFFFLISSLSRRRGLADLLLWTFFMLFLAWPGWLQTIAAHWPFGTLHKVENTPAAVAVVMLFCVCYFFGWEAGWRGILRKAPGMAGRLGVQEGRMRVYLLALILIAAAGMAAFGPSRLLSSRVDLGAVLGDQSAAYPLFVAKGAALATLLLSFTLTANGGRLSKILIVTIAVFDAFLVFNPISNPRFQSLGLIFAMIGFFWGTLSPMKKSLGATLLFLACFGAFAAFKNIGSVGALGVVSLDLFRIAPYSVDFDSLQQTTGLVSYTFGNGVLYGLNFLGAALFFVPRLIWPHKPSSTSFAMGNYLGYNYVNVSAPLPGEAFAGGGVIGVIIVGWFLGRMIGQMEATRVKSDAPLTKAFYSVITGYTIILLRGSLLAVLPQFGLCFLFLGGARWVGAFRRGDDAGMVAVVGTPVPVSAVSGK